MNRLIPLFASATLLCAASAAPAAAPASPDTVDRTLPTQLPRSAIPHHYAITVTPHADRLSFDATIGIDLNVIQPTNQLVLNAANLKLATATLTGAKQGATLHGQVSLDEDAQTATLTFPRTIAPGAYHLAIDYSGKINTQANGLFALDYKNKAGKPA